MTDGFGPRPFCGSRSRPVLVVVAAGLIGFGLFGIVGPGLAAPARTGKVGPVLKPPLFAEVTEIPYQIAVLGALDKVTARVSTLEAPINEAVRFGTLSIIARSCYKRPPEETPEVSAFLEIRDVRDGDKASPRFSGWMFASSPAVSALEHPVYDVWVTNCKIPLPATESGKQ